MPSMKRHKTKYAGVYFIESKHTQSGKPERVYYIFYRKDGKQIEEKAGRQYQDDMTPARAAGIRAKRIQGKESSNEERREEARALRNEEDGRWTLDKIWEEYKAQRAYNKSLRVDENRYDNHIKPSFGSKAPDEIIQLDVDRLRIRLQKKYKSQTVRHILALLRRLVNFGAKKGLSPDLGFTIEMPTVHNEKTEDLDPDQLKSLLKAIDKATNTQVASIMKLALYSGMRRGELLKLQWDHVDFDRGFIEIVDPKGGLSQKIPLNDASRTLLEKHPRSKSPYVFPGRKGKQRTCIKKSANRIKEAAGLPKDFRALHGLRHVYASMLASSGKVDMYTLQKLLTHKSPSMTQRYAHLRDDALKQASDLAGQLVDEATKAEEKEPDKKVANMSDHK
ncbi:tyrosine-type recombinase/integrase [Desulfatibacillum aliphaticivorans]|uniref:tyrosine-type recombinase/integrase n=1 Tax=Desulfatibacillum aliphaticivorans TaxID=218208 RepID=UPI00042A4327|nr:site-specific integrase [Desulfatibacillum aliphaticivorans]